MKVVDVLVATVAASGLTKEQLVGPSRLRIHARPRHVGMFLSHRLTIASRSQIGKTWGLRDATTVRDAIERVGNLIAAADRDVVDLVDGVLDALALDVLPTTRPAVQDRPLLLARIATRERELQQLRADLAAFDAVHFTGASQ